MIFIRKGWAEAWVVELVLDLFVPYIVEGRKMLVFVGNIL